MAELTTVLWLTLAAGAAVPLGGLLAHAERVKNAHVHKDLVASVAAFGGGGLLSAVVLVLVPEAMEKGPAWLLVVAFAGGGIVAILLQVLFLRHGTKTGEAGALILHFAPESLALGAAAGSGEPAAGLLALLVGLQNLPEGFSSSKELHASPHRFPVFGLLVLIALLGPAAGVAGYFWLAGAPAAEAVVLMAAAGGILALVFDDIAPASHRERHPVPPLGMILGFTLGLVGHALLV